MTPEVYEWVKYQKQSFGLTGKVLDIGSMNITGCVRDLFDDYTGIDLRHGENVDLVADAHKLPFRKETFDVVCCLEMLEHDTNFFKTVSEAHRVLKNGGHFLLTARGNGYELHDFPCDYWRFTEDAFRLLFANFSASSAKESNMCVYGWAIK